MTIMLPEESAPLRILILAPFPPRLDGSNGGSRTIAQAVRGLARKNKVALLYLLGQDDEPVDPELEEHCDLAEAVERPSSGRSVAQKAGLLFGLLAGRPTWAARWMVPRFALRVKELLQAWRPDILQAEYPVMGQYLCIANGHPVKRVLTEHDPGTPASLEKFRAARGARKVLAWLSLRAWRNWEPRVLGMTNAVVVFTERDRQTIAGLFPDALIQVIPLAAAVPDQPLNGAGSERHSLLFVGSYQHPPNEEAALRLLNSIFPAIRSQSPETMLYLVGRNPTPAMEGCPQTNVVITGGVPDVAPWLDRASVVIAPIRLGGGMRVKIIESLAAGKCVVASPLAVEGLPVTDGDQLFIADSNQEFQSVVLRLWADPKTIEAIASRAYQWSSTHLNPEDAIDAREDLYRFLLGHTTASANSTLSLPPAKHLVKNA